jgi:hypothetical protein
MADGRCIGVWRAIVHSVASFVITRARPGPSGPPWGPWPALANGRVRGRLDRLTRRLGIPPMLTHVTLLGERCYLWRAHFPKGHVLGESLPVA